MPVPLIGAFTRDAQKKEGHVDLPFRNIKLEYYGIISLRLSCWQKCFFLM